MVMCPSYATVAPTGGNKPLLGTNPFAFGWPRPAGPPYVFDFATSVTARGEVELHRQAGRPLPEGWAIDATAGRRRIPRRRWPAPCCPSAATRARRSAP